MTVANDVLIEARGDIHHKHPDTSKECRTLSTTLHAYCRQYHCDCTCHERGHVSWKSNNVWERPHKD